MLEPPGERSRERSARLMLGVVVERRAIDHPWQKWRWRPVSVILHAPPVEGLRELVRDEAAGVVQYHAATLPLEVHRTETEDYKYNLSGQSPAVYVVMRPSGQFGDGPPSLPARLTASPWEAQAYSEGSDDEVEAVPMPEPLIAWLKAFVDRHHVDRPFYKRRRKGRDHDAAVGSEFTAVGDGDTP